MFEKMKTPQKNIENEKWEEKKNGKKRKETPHCCPQLRGLRYLLAFHGHSGRQRIDPDLQDHVLIPNGFTDYIFCE